jgi:NADPH-dependent curcumin reductase CurA
MNRRWLIAARPLGRAVAAEDFRLEARPIAQPGPGQLLLRTLYLGFDPAQKARMENIAGYAAPTEIGGVMPGTAVGQVIESRMPGFAPGDIVIGESGWEEFPVVDATRVAAVPDGVSPTAALGVIGMTGRTAYFGLLHIGKPRVGDTLVISGAAGAVGSVVGQLGKLAGCRVIGIAGGAEKCAWLVDELGFDEAIDYKAGEIKRSLKQLCPRGIDIVFDNVGGEVLNECLARIGFGARVVICGGIARYDADPRDPDQMPPGPRNYFNVVFTKATIQGFLVSHFESLYAVADARLASLLAAGKLDNPIDLQHGFENAPRTLLRLFRGENRGKQVLKIAER